MEIDQLGRLQDVREACGLIEAYVQGVAQADFLLKHRKAGCGGPEN
jgi:hypothetical protein